MLQFCYLFATNCLQHVTSLFNVNIYYWPYNNKIWSTIDTITMHALLGFILVDLSASQAEKKLNDNYSFILHIAHKMLVVK